MKEKIYFKTNDCVWFYPNHVGNGAELIEDWNYSNFQYLDLVIVNDDGRMIFDCRYDSETQSFRHLEYRTLGEIINYCIPISEIVAFAIEKNLVKSVLEGTGYCDSYFSVGLFDRSHSYENFYKKKKKDY